ncbi:helix-turn-helix protein [Maritalea mobilis]|uniref:Helix-turn-helix protein n=1 Tax=Maritalea mobilis TaxID=483324 RepID=A0A4R6VG69_9HYPH|nr:helix-turn-helix domain-containing protein [Maritalea mobilis]TDQ60450.1 helix-turn-helix protein [Maritalea mobilis]
MNEFERDIINSMQEAVDMQMGKPIGRTTVISSPKQVRKLAKLTQKEMAELMGMSLSTYQKWERGVQTAECLPLNLLRIIEKDPDAVINTLSSNEKSHSDKMVSNGA